MPCISVVAILAVAVAARADTKNSAGALAPSAATDEGASKEDGSTDASSATDPELISGDESPELRALRLAELELFGAEHTEPEQTGLHLQELPPALTTEVRGDDVDAAAAEDPASLDYLSGIEQPDIPIRWDERVIDFLEFYRNDPRGRRLMRAWLERLHRWGPAIRARLRERGMPEDLVFVAMVESGFDPSARSHAAAVGMWQFVKRTGIEYGLEQNHWVDERMNPFAATDAAAQFLSDLYRRLGSWELAFAGYNMGYGGILRAIRKYNTNDYWVLSRLEAGLPFETTIYVAKIMAAAVVGRNPERFGFDDLGSIEPLELAEVAVPGGAPLSLAARAASIDVETLASLNPELKRNRVPPNVESWMLRVPATSKDRFAEEWTRLRPRDPAYRSYVFRFGEKLEDVARRFRTSTRTLRSLNELEDEEDVLPGTTLLVPAVEPREPRDSTSEPPVVSVPAKFDLDGRRRVFYRVRGGESVDEIAGFFEVSIDEVRRWNRVDPSARLQRGMYLQLYVRPSVDLRKAIVLTEDDCKLLVLGSEEFYSFHEEKQGRVRFRYAVRDGDTLSSIAKRFNLEAPDLARINKIAEDSVLRVGQPIVIYAAKEDAPREALLDRADDDGADDSSADDDRAEPAEASAPPVEPSSEAG